MDYELRRTAFYLLITYWAALWLASTGCTLPISFLPMAYPLYRCSRSKLRSVRMVFLGALVCLALACAPAVLPSIVGMVGFVLFLGVGNLGLALVLGNRQAALLLALAPLMPFVGAWAEGIGLLLLWLSAPAQAPPPRKKMVRLESFPEI